MKRLPLLYATLAFALAWGIRLPFSPSPLHDEAITMLAAKGMEREYNAALASGDTPFGKIVPASAWHKFTSDYSPLSFRAVHQDMAACDIHPPLAFWIYNLWLSLFKHGAYQHALVLSGIQILLTGLVVYGCVWRLTRSAKLAGFGALAIYVTNSALVTSLYVRQYALLALLVALTVLVIILLIEEAAPARIEKTVWTQSEQVSHEEQGSSLHSAFGIRHSAFAAVFLAALCLAGMLTQYLYAVVTGPLHLGLLTVLISRRSWARLSLVLGAYGVSAALLYWITPEAFLRALSKTDPGQAAVAPAGLTEAVSQIMNALFHLPAFLPRSLAVIAGVIFFVLLVCIAVLSWRVTGTTQRALRPQRTPLLPSVSSVLFGGQHQELATKEHKDVRTAEEGCPSVAESVTCARVLTTGAVVALALQIVLVALGVFPAWATGAPYLCSLVVMLVIALALVAHWYPRRFVYAAFTGLCIAMALSQVTYVARRVATKDLMQIHYARKLKPDLVIIDDLRRGMLLPLTMCLPPERKVLAVSPEALVRIAATDQGRTEEVDGINGIGEAQAHPADPVHPVRFPSPRGVGPGVLGHYARVLYLMEDDWHLKRGRAVLDGFEKSGWKIERLQTLHPGMHDAFMLTRAGR